MRRLSRRFARMRFALVVIAGVLISSPLRLALAQDQNNPEVLRKELADALAQLKAAQDRKNELAGENDKLKAQLSTMQKEVDEVRRAQATWAEQSYYLRSQHAAWNDFLERYPRLRAEWEVFLSAGPFAAPSELPLWADPLAAIATAPPPTQPTTAPATNVTTTSATATTTTATTTTPAATTGAATTTSAPSTTNAAPATQPTTKG